MARTFSYPNEDMRVTKAQLRALLRDTHEHLYCVPCQGRRRWCFVSATGTLRRSDFIEEEPQEETNAE